MDKYLKAGTRTRSKKDKVRIPTKIISIEKVGRNLWKVIIAIMALILMPTVLGNYGPYRAIQSMERPLLELTGEEILQK